MFTIGMAIFIPLQLPMHTELRSLGVSVHWHGKIHGRNSDMTQFSELEIKSHSGVAVCRNAS